MEEPAYRIAEVLAEALQSEKTVHWVLTGGRSPTPVYRELTENRTLDWSRVHLWFSDDRCVPLDSSLSNYKTVKDHLADPLGLSESQIHRICGELGKNLAAEYYNAELHACFPVFPQFDLVLLGMGDDGHIASLFPNRSLNLTQTPWAEGVDAPTHIEPHVDRVTLTLPLLNAAKNRMVLISGKAKTALFNQIYPLRDSAYPVCRLTPEHTEFFLSESS